jgi:hypothetical protein
VIIALEREERCSLLPMAERERMAATASHALREIRVPRAMANFLSESVLELLFDRAALEGEARALRERIRLLRKDRGARRRELVLLRFHNGHLVEELDRVRKQNAALLRWREPSPAEILQANHRAGRRAGESSK